MLRGADPPRALRVTALANLCPCFAPVCPQRGRPGAKDKNIEAEPTSNDSGSALHASASLLRQARFIARSRAVHEGRTSRALAPARPRA